MSTRNGQELCHPCTEAQAEMEESQARQWVALEEGRVTMESDYFTRLDCVLRGMGL